MVLNPKSNSFYLYKSNISGESIIFVNSFRVGFWLSANIDGTGCPKTHEFNDEKRYTYLGPIDSLFTDLGKLLIEEYGG